MRAVAAPGRDSTGRSRDGPRSGPERRKPRRCLDRRAEEPRAWTAMNEQQRQAVAELVPGEPTAIAQHNRSRSFRRHTCIKSVAHRSWRSRDQRPASRGAGKANRLPRRLADRPPRSDSRALRPPDAQVGPGRKDVHLAEPASPQSRLKSLLTRQTWRLLRRGRGQRRGGCRGLARRVWGSRVGRGGPCPWRGTSGARRSR